MAATAVGSYLSDADSGRQTRAEFERLYVLVDSRLRANPADTVVLENLVRAPSDPILLSAVCSILQRNADNDPHFAASLIQSVQAVSISRGPDVAALASHEVVITDSELLLRHSVIAGGNVDQSRRSMKIGFGGLVVALLLGATGVVAHQIKGSVNASWLFPEKDSLTSGAAPLKHVEEVIDDTYPVDRCKSIPLNYEKSKSVCASSTPPPKKSSARVIVDVLQPMSNLSSCNIQLPSNMVALPVVVSVQNLNTEYDAYIPHIFHVQSVPFISRYAESGSGVISCKSNPGDSINYEDWPQFQTRSATFTFTPVSRSVIPGLAIEVVVSRAALGREKVIRVVL
ncbi:hypothetical protein [Amycolatopsis sp. WAC 01375]|uniref:hypothetical protein n=1 Tax=Amycolatopsis sp. WAC 01375 TaxID=2203194 RepID=UPI000F7A7D75|nr:hypothetical protein [Amycolatopsis sp. WAC 01375]